MPASPMCLAAADVCALLDADGFEVGVGRHVAIGVADEDEVAVALDARADIDHLAILGGADRRAFRRLDIDAGLLAGDEVGDDLARDRASGTCRRPTSPVRPRRRPV